MDQWHTGLSHLIIIPGGLKMDQSQKKADISESIRIGPLLNEGDMKDFRLINSQKRVDLFDVYMG